MLVLIVTAWQTFAITDFAAPDINSILERILTPRNGRNCYLYLFSHFLCLAVTDFKSNSRIHDILHRWANKEVANRLCYIIAIWAPRQAYSLNKNHDIRRKIPLCELRSRFDLRLSDVLDKTDKKRRIQYSHFDGCDHRSWTDGVHLNNWSR